MASIGGTTALRQALRHRPVQSVGLVLLATLISAAVSFAPLFVRALEQSAVRLDLGDRPVSQTGLSLSSVVGPTDLASGRQSLGPDSLLALVPASIRRHFGAPVATQEGRAAVAHAPRSGTAITGELLSSRGQCAHLTIVNGRCPQGGDEVAISTADVSVLHLRIGDSLPVDVVDTDGNPTDPETMHVVGVYRQVPGAYWFSRILTGKAGTPDASGVQGQPATEHDDWITSEATFDSILVNTSLPNGQAALVMPIDRAHTGVDQLLALGKRLQKLSAHIAATDYASSATVSTSLPDLVRDVQVQQRQARITVPLIVLQLALLGLFVLWLVLSAVADQRRPEVALALLRGRGRRGARRQFFVELALLMLAGVAGGGVVAAVVSSVCRRVVLPKNPPLELRWPFWASLAGIAAVLIVVIAIAVHLLTRQPVEALLRRVGSRHRPLGIPEALLVAAAGTGTLAFVTGGLTGNAALAGPAILALFVGVALSLVAMPVAASTGRALLRRGRLTSGLTLLDAARSPALRRTVAVVTVATALMVFAVDAAVVGARNRQLAAEQYVGAPRVLTVDGIDLKSVRQAIREVDPSGRLATPVVTMQPPGTLSLTTMAVVPDGFGKVVARGELAALPLGRLRSPPAHLLRLVGDTVVVRVRHISFDVDNGGPAAHTLTFSYINVGGGTVKVAAGQLPRRSHSPVTFRVPVACDQGCELLGFGLAGGVGIEVNGAFSLDPLQVRSSDGTRTSIDLAPATQWHRARGETDENGTIKLASPHPDALNVDVDTASAGSVNVDSDWFPAAVPALLAGPMPPQRDGDVFPLAGLDGQPRDGLRVAEVARVPSAPRNTAVVDLDTLQRGALLDGGDQIGIWLGRDDPALVHKLSTALAKRHIHVSDSASISARRTTYDQSAAAWSLGLGVAAGIVALLIALGVMAVIVSTGSRTRTHDLAALRLAGLRVGRLRRIVVGHQLLAVVLAVVAGAVTGTIGAQLALDDIPIFTTRPTVPTLDLGTSWPAVLVAAASALLLLGGAGIYLGRRLTRAARLLRLREVE